MARKGWQNLNNSGAIFSYEAQLWQMAEAIIGSIDVAEYLQVQQASRQASKQAVLGQLIDLFSQIRVGNGDSRAKNILGCLNDYFLCKFASVEGKKVSDPFLQNRLGKFGMASLESRGK